VPWEVLGNSVASCVARLACGPAFVIISLVALTWIVTSVQVGVVNTSRVGPDDLKTLKKLSFQVHSHTHARATLYSLDCNKKLAWDGVPR